MKRGRSDEKQSKKHAKSAKTVVVAPPPGVFYGANYRKAAASYYGTKQRGYVDLANATYSLNTTGSIGLIATVAQGAATTQRIGKRIQLKSVQVRGMAYVDSATTITHWAIMVVYDNKPTGSLPAITDILDSASSFSFTKNDNQGRFSILMRRQGVLTGVGTAPVSGNEAYDINEFVKVNRPCVFKSAGTGAIGDIEEGALYYVTVGMTASGTADGAVHLGFRTTFKDIQG